MAENLLGFHFVGLRDRKMRFAKMSEGGLVDAAMEAAEPLTRAIEMVYHDDAPYGGDYDRDREALNESFHVELKAMGTGWDMRVTTSEPDAAQFSDSGRGPGAMPPIEAISGWALFHDIDPWALAVSIALKGTEAHPWLDRAREDTLPIIDLLKVRIAARVKEVMDL